MTNFSLLKRTPYAYIHHLMTLPPNALVRLYSYQSMEAWEAAQKKGYWTGSEDHVPDEDFREFRIAYEWMRSQMRERIPNFSGDLPMWAWIKRPSTKPQEARYMGTSGAVRLTLLVPRERIVFSEYDTWHSVLNVSRLCRTEDQAAADGRKWYANFGYDRFDENGYRKEYLDDIRPSWQGCLEFKPATTEKERDYGLRDDKLIVQACIDRFYWNEVVDVRWFTQQ